MTTTVDDLVAQIPPERREQFSPTRYPYTYACDFIRQYPYVVPDHIADDRRCYEILQRQFSRAEASKVRQVWADWEGREDEEMAIMLADAFLRVHGIERPS